MSVDGTDCPIMEPSPFIPSWFSHKINRAGLRYELGLSGRKANIVWANGPFPCGAFSDVRIFRTRLKPLLGIEEFAIGESGYTDVRCVRAPHHTHALHRPLSLIRARHEIVNSHLKKFRVLSTRYRHDIHGHEYFFFAVLIVTHLELQNRPKFNIQLSWE